jgi:hypothetical protein
LKGVPATNQPMKKLFTLFAFTAALHLCAQTQVNTASFTFSGGVYPTFSTLFTKADAALVEKWYKEQLKGISADMGGKKEIMSIGTRLPEISSDTIRVFVKVDQPKKSEDVTVHAAFRVNGVFVGPDSDPRQTEGCRSWMYQRAVMLKKELVQKELDEATRHSLRLESDMANLVKEKDRAQGNLEKTQQRITEDEKEKADTDGRSTSLASQVDAKRQEIANGPTEKNAKEMQDLLKEQGKLKSTSEKLTKSIADGKNKVVEIQEHIKKNLAEQDAKGKAIEAQKKLVEELRTKLANVN